MNGLNLFLPSVFSQSQETTLESLASIEKTKELIEQNYTKNFEKEVMENPEKFLKSLEKIVEKTKIHISLEEVKSFIEKELQFASVFQQALLPPPSSLKTKTKDLLASIVLQMDNMVQAFGIKDLFDPPKHEWSASQKVHTISMLRATISEILTVPYKIGFAMFSAFFILLSLIWDKLEPIPSFLPKCQNLSDDEVKGNKEYFGRVEVIQTIGNILKIGKHPILVGPSRVGKTHTVKAFAKAVGEGKIPELKGKKVFYVNSSILVEKQPSWASVHPLKALSERMGRHRDNIILVLDEIHMVAKGEEKLADVLKTMLDEGGELPHVVGITTDKEYAEYVEKNRAFSLRFQPILLKGSTESETKLILSQFALKHPSRPIMEEGTIDLILRLSSGQNEEDLPQPQAGLNLLKRCINHIQTFTMTDRQNKILCLEREILSLLSVDLVGNQRTSSLLIERKEEELKALKKEESLTLERLENFEKLKSFYQMLRRERFESVLESSKYQTKGDKGCKKAFWAYVLQHFIEPVFLEKIKGEAKELGLEPLITRDLVQKLAGKNF
ncbi:MAG: ATP-dependent Clp protease ATP-binding subunit [Chlamydiae bacterium]|nr:ATP-dependent Clp protease ATP-binding subunit [Chlamydiota bacterium]